MDTEAICILLVEDDPDDVALVRAYLAGAPDVSAVLEHVARLTAALDRLDSSDTDLVLLDLMLPDSSGLETFRRVHVSHPQVPVVVMTGVKSDGVAFSAVHEGAEDYLCKNDLTSELLIHTIRYAVERAEARRIERTLQASQREMAIAQQIQQSLFPQSLPNLAGFEVAGASFPATHVGGDYFDFLSLADGYLAIAIGDASGHGMGAALLSSETRATLRSLAMSHTSVDEIVTLANRLLSGSPRDGHFITLFLGRLNPYTGSFVYTSAGHEPGFVLDASSQIKAHLHSTGMPLGIVPDCEYPGSVALEMAPGDVAVLFTDGVREARPRQGEPFGLDRAIDVVRTHQHEPSRQIIHRLEAAVRRYCHPHAPHDDLTIVVVKVSPAARFSPFAKR